jgi:hypothetical protein
MERLVPLEIDGRVIGMISVRTDGSIYLLVRAGDVRKSISMETEDFNRMFKDVL